MGQKYLEFLDKPAEKEYFTRFVEILSRDQTGKAVCVSLDKKVLYCDKVKVGETLVEAAGRSMADDFGLKLVACSGLASIVDKAKNKLGETLPRIGIVAYVEYGPLKDEVVGCRPEWIDRKDYFMKGNNREKEALGWLKDGNCLAGNRFTDSEAIAFVERLYEAGAIDVEVIDINIARTPQYADSLDVLLPKDPKSREKLFKISNEELQIEFPGEKEEIDKGQKGLFFWWD